MSPDAAGLPIFPGLVRYDEVALHGMITHVLRFTATKTRRAYQAAAQVILRALKTYGMITTDNGSDFFLSGTADSRSNDDVNNPLRLIRVDDFEVVRITGIVTP